MLMAITVAHIPVNGVLVDVCPFADVLPSFSLSCFELPLLFLISLYVC
jgi:hypothetical protein